MCAADAPVEMALLTPGEFDGNDPWGPEERRACESSPQALVGVSQKQPSQRIWVLCHAADVFGPFQLSAVMDVDMDVERLACVGTDTPWVDPRLERLTAAREREPSREPDPVDP